MDGDIEENVVERSSVEQRRVVHDAVWGACRDSKAVRGPTAIQNIL